MRVHPEILEQQKLPPALVTKRNLAGAVRGHPRLRALPDAQRRGHPQVLPARLQEGAEEALPGAPGGAGEELEVLAADMRGARATGTTT